MKTFATPLFLLIPLFSLIMEPVAIHAKSLYAPPGIYDVEQFKLPNGLRVLLKPRSQARNVSFRLTVHVGSRHFDCSRVETPHVLEHLLFSGTSKHTEAELDRLIEERGGSWNAVTGQEYTTYEVDIFDRYGDIALDTLYEIMTDTVITREKLVKAGDIVANELGGHPSFIRQLLYDYDIGKSGWQKANEWLLPGDPAACDTLPATKDITERAVRDTFRSFYTPENMTLVIVGQFDRDAMLKRIRRTFGKLGSAAGMGGGHEIKSPPYPSGGPVQVSSIFAPFLGNSGDVGAAYRTGGSDSQDAPALRVLAEYLNKLLYERVRVEKALSYNPEVSFYFRPDYGILYVSADSGLRKIDDVQNMIGRVLHRVVNTPPSDEEVERTKQRLLLRWVQGYETNRGLADFYVRQLHDLNTTGMFRNYEQEIEAVTAADVARVIRATLRDDRKVEVYGVPTISYTRFYTVIGIMSFLVLLTMIVMLRRALTARKKTPWYRR